MIAWVRIEPKEWPVPMTVENVEFEMEPDFSVVMRECRISTSSGACTTERASGVEDLPTPRRS